ncbi:hypothetical protein [Frankia sp. Cr1]|uniref:hypothetical protein n=1 Tax=Frankia sp. Cr1 TaxID=3073931 RepID=UPI002AD4B597|nr:hypothetical protein [Frankia sp. Cr1]
MSTPEADCPLYPPLRPQVTVFAHDVDPAVAAVIAVSQLPLPAAGLGSIRAAGTLDDLALVERNCVVRQASELRRILDERSGVAGLRDPIHDLDGPAWTA